MFFATTMAGLIAGIESTWRCVDGLPWSRAQTGERYVVIGDQADAPPAIPGTIDEGASRVLAYDEETAVVQAVRCLAHYAEDRSGILYWRVRPRLESWYGADEPGRRRRRWFKVYMRLLISDKPAAWSIDSMKEMQNMVAA